MKKLLYILLFLGACFSSQAQKFRGIDKSPLDVQYFPGNTTQRFFKKHADKKEQMAPKIKVYYSRPKKKGREIFGDLVPYGKLWRTGANETTEIKFYVPVKIGETKVLPGTYTLATLPNKKEWTLYINKVTDSWGTYVFDQEQTIAEVKAKTTISDETIEAFSMVFYKESASKIFLRMGWDTTIVDFPIEIID